MTLLRPDVQPSDIFLTGETTKFVGADGQMRAPQSTDLSGVEADIAALQANDSTQDTNITNLQTADTGLDSRLGALEAHSFPRIIASDFSAATVTASTETTLASLSVPGGTLAATSVYEACAYGTWASTNPGAGTPILRVYFGGTLVATFPNLTAASGGSVWEVVTRGVNVGSVSSQDHLTRFSVYISAVEPNTAIVSAVRATSAIDTSSVQTLDVTCQNDAGATANSTVCQIAYLTLVASS